MRLARRPPHRPARQADGMLMVAVGAALSASVAAAWPQPADDGGPSLPSCRCPMELPAGVRGDRAQLGCAPSPAQRPGDGPAACDGRATARASWLLLAGVGLELNLATAHQLAELPGVGPKLAAAIVAHRRGLGGFDNTAQLAQVPGVGPRKLAQLLPLLRLGAPGA